MRRSGGSGHLVTACAVTKPRPHLLEAHAIAEGDVVDLAAEGRTDRCGLVAPVGSRPVGWSEASRWPPKPWNRTMAMANAWLIDPGRKVEMSQNRGQWGSQGLGFAQQRTGQALRHLPAPNLPKCKGWRSSRTCRFGSQLARLLLEIGLPATTARHRHGRGLPGITRTGKFFRAQWQLQAADTSARVGWGESKRCPATTIKAAPCWRATDAKPGNGQSAAPA